MSEPKDFAFGDLNPVETPRTQKRLDTKHTTALGAMREAVIGTFTPNALEGTGPYKGIVLRVELDGDMSNPAPGNWLATAFGSGGLFSFLSPPKPLKRYKVRIPEIHATLPVPSQVAASTEEEGEHQKVIDMYPTFVAKDSECELASPGDLVWVDFGHRSNFEDPTFLGPVFPGPQAGTTGPGGNGTNPSDAFSAAGGALGCGGLGSAASGGSLPGVSSSITSQDAPWANGMYLSISKAKARNNQTSAGRHVTAGRRCSKAEQAKAYIQKGGSGKAVSGRVALGSCAAIEKPLDKVLTALRIACEDQADRGYAFGGKDIDSSVGGIDCSGFVQNVRIVTEWLLSADGEGYNLPEYKGEKWTKLVTHSSSQRNSSSAQGNWRNISGDSNSNWNEKGAVSGNHIMPGDEIAYANPPVASDHFAYNRFEQISHVLVVFADPNGELRVAESGGPFKGTGSRPLQEYLSAMSSKKLFFWERSEMKAIWDDINPNRAQPWNKEWLGEEYFSAPTTAAGATGDESQSATTVNGAAPAGDATQVAPPPAGSITKDNVTLEQALACALNDSERAEVMGSNPASLAHTAAAKRAIEKSQAEANSSSATPASESTAANHTSPPPTSYPASGCGVGGAGGHWSPAVGAQQLATATSGTSIGNVPFMGTKATNPFQKMKIVRIKSDKARTGHPKVAGKKGGGGFRTREDVAPNLAEVKRILNELGCVLASSGSTRRLTASVGPGRSATSFHYTSAAVDILTTGMLARGGWKLEGRSPSYVNTLGEDEYVVEFRPEKPKWYQVWARTNRTSGSVEKNGVVFEVEHKTLNGIRKMPPGQPPGIYKVTGYFVNLTKIMWAHGLSDIPGRRAFYRDSTGASEAWHFDFRKNMGLQRGKTTFGDVLKTMHEPSNLPPWQSAQKVWSGGTFK